MIWFVYWLLQVFIWQPSLRCALLPQEPVVHLISEVLNDLIYVPIALFLPVAVIRAIIRVAPERKTILSALFLMCWVGLTLELGLLRPLLIFSLVYIFAFFQLKRSFSFSRLGYLLCLVTVLLHYRSQLFPPLPSNRPSLTLMSFNMNTHVFAYNDERTMRLIREQLPDIVFLQECHRLKIRALVTRLVDLYPYQCGPGLFQGQGDVLILSRFPLTALDPIVLRSKSATYGRLVNHAVVDIKGRKVHLINCHLTHAGKELKEWVFGGFRKADWENLLTAERGRQEEFNQLIQAVKSVEGPLILAGDFNEPTNGKNITWLSRHLVNAFSRAGWGVGATYGGYPLQKKLPKLLASAAVDYLRIDHLFCSSHFCVETAKVYSVGAFDHRPLIVRLSWRKNR